MSHESNQPIGVRFGVDGYPTVVIFKNGLKARTFDFPGFPDNTRQSNKFEQFLEWATHVRFCSGYELLFYSVRDLISKFEVAHLCLGWGSVEGAYCCCTAIGFDFETGRVR